MKKPDGHPPLWAGRRECQPAPAQRGRAAARGSRPAGSAAFQVQPGGGAGRPCGRPFARSCRTPCKSAPRCRRRDRSSPWRSRTAGAARRDTLEQRARRVIVGEINPVERVAPIATHPADGGRPSLHREPGDHLIARRQRPRQFRVRAGDARRPYRIAIDQEVGPPDYVVVRSRAVRERLQAVRRPRMDGARDRVQRRVESGVALITLGRPFDGEDGRIEGVENTLKLSSSAF